jgi:hypothetical protein|tara:strand:+ start:1814 stop:2020 length:207 start_codon:yes stop_codon:yes gene_type:complete
MSAKRITTKGYGPKRLKAGPRGINYKGERVREQLEGYARDPSVYKRSVIATPGTLGYKHGGRFRPQHN